MDNTAIRYPGHIRENQHHNPFEMNPQTNNVESLFEYLEDNKLSEFMHVRLHHQLFLYLVR